MNRLVKKVIKEQQLDGGLTDTLSGTEFGNMMKGTKGTWSVENDGSLVLIIDDGTKKQLFKIV